MNSPEVLGVHFFVVSMKCQPIQASFTPETMQKSQKSAEIPQRCKERNTQDFRTVYFNLFFIILPKFGSLSDTTIILYRPLNGPLQSGLPVVLLQVMNLHGEHGRVTVLYLQWTTVPNQLQSPCILLYQYIKQNCFIGSQIAYAALKKYFIR